MKYADFPLLGRRPFIEFTIGGELEPEPETLTDDHVGRWVYRRNSVPRTRTEWWYHGPSRLWFTVVRDTATDTVIDTALARGEQRGDRE